MTDYDTETGEILFHPVTHRWSSPANEIFAALALAQADMANVGRDVANPHFRSKYASLGAVFEEVRPKLATRGLALVQMPINGAGSNIGIVSLMTHASGQWIESTIFCAPAKFDAQGVGSLITYLRRYAAMAMCGVGTEDDDGNAAVARPEGATAQQARPAATDAPARAQAYQRPVAAPANDERAEAQKRWKEIAAEIDKEMTVSAIDGWFTSPLWMSLKDRITALDGAERADMAMQRLVDRAEDRKRALMGGDTFGDVA